MAAVQRIMALLMAAGMVFIFLVPLAMARRQYTVVVIVITLFAIYLAVNAWLFVRMRRRS